jgi:hypothetical protein
VPALLAEGEWAVFHGPPGAAVTVLRRAAEAGQARGLLAAAGHAQWLLGAAWAAAGQYGAALSLLESLASEPPGGLARIGSLAASTAASVHRQLGRHPAGRELDGQARAAAGADAEARFDAELGLAADAVGLDEAGEARRRLDAAAGLAAQHHDWWRQRVRLEWVRAELALLVEEPEAAVSAADAAARGAEVSAARRHVAKSLLFRGVAERQARYGGAAVTLARAGALACELDAVPLVWPVAAVLSTLWAADPDRAAGETARARSAISRISTDLSEPLAREWLARPEIAALR